MFFFINTYVLKIIIKINVVFLNIRCMMLINYELIIKKRKFGGIPQNVLKSRKPWLIIEPMVT